MTLSCRTPQRRAATRRRGLNGIDGIDVGEDQRHLRAFLLAAAPADVGLGNVRLDGPGRTVRAVAVEPADPSDAGDPALLVEVDRPGDHSTYVLSLVEADREGRQGDEPLDGFDPRFASLPFSFKVDCPADVDCVPAPPVPPALPEPELSYLAADYESFRSLLLDRLAIILPESRERHVPDLQLTLVELLAYAADELAMFRDSVATEAYLGTARRRISVRRHARLVDYRVHDGCNARVWICVEVNGRVRLPAANVAFLAAGRPLGLPAPVVDCDAVERVPAGAAQLFEPVAREEIDLRDSHNAISFWTWGDADCRLEAGATAAALADGGKRGRKLALAPGDVVIFEEVKGRRTGVPADADPARRHAVRLTSVRPDVDPVFEQPLLLVGWAAEDALPFPLQLSTVAGDDCHPVDGVTIARGNVVLADHGGTVGWCHDEAEPLDPPVGEPGDPACEAPCGPVPVAPDVRRYAPRLARSPVTQAAPFPVPADLAAVQAGALAELPARARAVLDRVIAAVEDGDAPDADDVDLLVRLVGAAPVRDAGLPGKPVLARLRVLSARFARLLAGKARRLAAILARLHAGRPLTGPVLEELEESWGALVHRDALSGPATYGPAARVAEQDPRAALGVVTLESLPPDEAEPVSWSPRADLLSSDGDDPHFVGELDDDGTLVLRFAEQTGHGRAPVAGELFSARYRVGNGAAGNVPAEAVTRIVLRSTRTQGVVRVRNPLPAAGGVEPEPLADVRLLAPGSARREQRRAVTAADYAAAASAVPGVQQAVARLRWTGGWYEAYVAVDALGAAEPPAALLAAVDARLQAVRRLGHDVRVRPARRVPIHVDATLCLLPHASRALARDEAVRRIVAAFAPDELVPGEPIRASALVAALHGIAGVESAHLTALRRVGDETGEPVPASGLVPLGPLEVAELLNDPGQPARGLVRIDLRGGR